MRDPSGPATASQRLRLLLGVLAAALFVLGGSDRASRVVGSHSIRAQDLRSYVAYLAADERGGRGLGQPGLAQAEAFIAARFESVGLEPLPGGESYFLDFTLYGRSYDPRRTRLEIDLGAGSEEAVLGRDFRPFDFSALGTVEAPVVFAGYGMTAPESDYDDYAGLEVSGKVVFVLRHRPRESDPNAALKTAGGSDDMRFTAKAENARRHGAVAMLLVTDPLNHAAADDLRLLPGLALEPEKARERRGSPPRRQRSFLALQLSQPLAERLAGTAGYRLRELQRAVDRGVPPRSFDFAGIKARLGVGLRREAQPVEARNVVGFLPGSDPELSREWIVVGAHHDHLGRFSGEGDVIFNGADDNASGTAGVLALAGAFASADPPPKRSLVFATFSAEERGLLGSRALVEQGPLPMEKVGFMLNLDMIGRNPGRPVTVIGDGLAHPLREVVEGANQELDLPLSFAGGRYISNSDHDSFYRRDIPFLFFFTGLHTDYHQLGDHGDRLDYGRMERLVRLAYGTVERLANAQHLPRLTTRVAWLGGDIVAEGGGLLLLNADPLSQARQAGLKSGDRLLASGDVARSATALLRDLRQVEPGSTVAVRVERTGEGSREIRLGRRPKGYLGVFMAGVDQSQRGRYGLSRGEGVLLQEVLPGGPAARAGLRSGDVLIRLADRRVSPETLSDLLELLGAGQTVEAKVRRATGDASAELTLGRRP